MKNSKTILLYGAALAVLTLGLKFLEYRFWVRDLSVEVYIGIIAMLFTALGIWVGWQLLNMRRTAAPQPMTSPMAVNSTDIFIPNTKALQNTQLSIREREVLELMAAGHSNQEIADKLFVSLSTVKTHTTNLYTKLDVKRRTQAVQRAKDLQLIP